MRILLIAALTLMTALPAMADETDPIFKLDQNESLLHISASETREVDQDLLVANLQIKVESEESRKVQNDINVAMKKALDEAKKYGDVKAITRQYNVHQYDRNAGKKNMPRRMVWRGQQSLQLKSKNAEQLLELAGKIQDMDFNMNGLSYTLSPELAAQIQDEMLEDVLTKLQNRAMRAAKALGQSKAVLKEINTQGNYRPHTPVYARGMAVMEMASDAKMAAPVASPGETSITLNVSARALLR